MMWLQYKKHAFVIPAWIATQEEHRSHKWGTGHTSRRGRACNAVALRAGPSVRAGLESLMMTPVGVGLPQTSAAPNIYR